MIKHIYTNVSFEEVLNAYVKRVITGNDSDMPNFYHYDDAYQSYATIESIDLAYGLIGTSEGETLTMEDEREKSTFFKREIIEEEE